MDTLIMLYVILVPLAINIAIIGAGIYLVYLLVKFLRMKIKEMEDDKHEKPRY